MKKLWFFIKTRWDEILILGIAIQLFVWSLTTGDLTLILVVTISLVALLILIYVIVDRISRNKVMKTIGENTAFELPRRGMIFTIGKQASTIEFAIKHQKPQFVGLVCTDATESIAEQIIIQSGIAASNIRKRLVDPYNIQEIRTTTDSLIHWMQEEGLTRPDIVTDVTGGLTPLSLGVYSAAHDQNVDTQYVRSRYDEQNKVIAGTQEGILIVHFPTT
jgi:hypothetical protein